MDDPTQAAEGIHQAIKWNAQSLASMEVARLNKIAMRAFARGEAGAICAAVFFLWGMGRRLPDWLHSAVCAAISSGRLDLLKAPGGEDVAR
jgi:hypothetical protein